MKCWLYKFNNNKSQNKIKCKINSFNSNNNTIQKQIKKGQFIFFPVKPREKIIKNTVLAEISKTKKNY